MDTASTFTLAVLAGAFIALGGVFATTALAGAGTVPWGPTRVLGGVAFSLGLVLVIVGGAELVTGNNLIGVGEPARGHVRASQKLAHRFHRELRRGE
jgi:formate transporter